MGIVENTYAELKQQELKNNPYSCLHMADIDINPHQIEAFTFSFHSWLFYLIISHLLYHYLDLYYYYEFFSLLQLNQ